MDYVVRWAPKFASRTYTANITSIHSPVAFEGCAVDLVADVLAGQPARYQTKVSTESLVLIASNPGE
jgi:hypothetical protein